MAVLPTALGFLAATASAMAGQEDATRDDKVAENMPLQLGAAREALRRVVGEGGEVGLYLARARKAIDGLAAGVE